MGFFKRLFGGGGEAGEVKGPEQAVLVYLNLSGDEFGNTDEQEEIFHLQHTLTEAIESNEAGEFDGNEFGGGECVLFMYGPDADRLFRVVEGILRESPVSKGGYAIKRYGEATDPEAKEVRIELN